MSVEDSLYFGLHSSEIRLLKLAAGGRDDEVQCKLAHASLSNKPIFDALSYAWGSRKLWTLQEVVVPKNVTIIYGSCVSTWDMFLKAANVYTAQKASEAISLVPPEHTKVLDRYSQKVLDIEAMKKRWISDEQTTLLPLLRQFSGRKATDDLDRVYALLGLVRGGIPIPAN